MDINQQIANHVEAIMELEKERPRVVFPFRTELYKEILVDSAHLLPNHYAKCKNLHGHTYRVGITVEGKLDERIGHTLEGMVLDFGHIKEIMKHNVDESFDHRYLNFLSFKKDDGGIAYFRTTAEQLAWYVFIAVDALLQELYDITNNGDIFIKQVDVWETPTSRATAKVEHYDRDLMQSMGFGELVKKGRTHE